MRPGQELRAEARRLGFALVLQPTAATLYDVYYDKPRRKVADRMTPREVTVFLRGAERYRAHARVGGADEAV